MSGFYIDKNKIFVQENNVKISFPEDGHKSLVEIENTSFWFRHRNSIILKMLERYPIGGDFVDIGGGNGYQLREIEKINNHNKNVLIEPGYDGCLVAKKRGVNLIYNGVFQDVNFDDYEISGVSLFDVLEHIENDMDFLNQLLLKLKSKSRIYITVPAHNYLWSDVDPYGGHYRRYNRKMVIELSKKLNVELEYFSYFFSYLYPISYFLRALPYKLGRRVAIDNLVNNQSGSHNPTGIVKKVFSFFEKLELKIMSKYSIFQGASCFFILKK